MFGVFSIAVLCIASSAAIVQSAALSKSSDLALPGDGSWGYLTVDPDAGRVYVAHSTKIDVVDANKGEIVGHVEGLAGARGVAVIHSMKRGFATSEKNNRLVVFNLDTLKVTDNLEVGPGPDSVLYVSSVGEVWTMNRRGGTITCVDAKSLRVQQTIEVGGALECAVEDPAKGMVYVNVGDRGLLAAIDAKSHEVVQRYPVVPGKEPTGLALDAKNGLLFLGCRNETLVVMAAANGSIVTSLKIGERCRGVAFDPGSGIIAASCRGASSVIHEKDAKTFEPRGQLDAGRTCAVDPKTHRLFIASGERGVCDSVRLLTFKPK